MNHLISLRGCDEDLFSEEGDKGPIIAEKNWKQQRVQIYIWGVVSSIIPGRYLRTSSVPWDHVWGLNCGPLSALVQGCFFCLSRRVLDSNKPTDLNLQFKNWHRFPPAMGSTWGYLGSSHDENNCDSSSVYVTCICCGLSMKINTHEKPHRAQDQCRHVHKDHGHIL